jgi:hypothetical protein
MIFAVAPPNLIGIDSGFFYTILYTMIGLALAMIAVVGVFIWYEVKKTSPNVRRLRKAINKGKAVMAIGFDDGHVVIAGVDDVGAEGELRIKAKKQDFIFFAPRASYDPDGLIDRPLMQMMTEGQTIDGRPFLLAYAGKTIATNIQTLAALGVPDELVAVGQAGTDAKPDGTRLNGGTPEVIKPQRGKFTFNKTKVTVIYALWNAVIKNLKSAFPKMYNQAQIRADERQAENTGWLKAKKNNEGRQYIPVIIILVLVFGIIGVLGLIGFLLK